MNEILPARDRNSILLDPNLQALASADIAPLFLSPELLGAPSAWWTHVPFAFWIMTACRPRIFVELGSHYGVSYAAFCKANLEMGGPARCFAVDTWQGDEHAGFYDDTVYQGLKSFNDSRFAEFSTLIRSTFDDASERFPDGSIDLLHIDGRHRYEDVKHDFETWAPKLSSRAVVLFHDTNVFEKDFGVFRFFKELNTHYPTFEFLHGFGLGIALVGAEAPEALRSLCVLHDLEMVNALRARFQHLGERWLSQTREILAAADHADQMAATDAAHADELAATNAAHADQIAAADVSHAGQIVAVNASHADELAATNASHADQMTAADAAHADELAAANAAHADEIATVGAYATEMSREVERLQSMLQIERKIHDRALQRIIRMRETIEQMGGNLRNVSQSLTIFVAASHFMTRRGDAFRNLHANLKFAARKAVLTRLGSRGVNSLERMIQADLVRRSSYFDRRWYLAAYPDVKASGGDPARHYALFGHKEGREPSLRFYGAQYLENNPDVAAAGVNPLIHFILYGEAEGRSFLPRAATQPPPPVRKRAARKSERFAILFVSGEANTRGHVYRVERLVEAVKANACECDWIDATSSDSAEARFLQRGRYLARRLDRKTCGTGRGHA